MKKYLTILVIIFVAIFVIALAKDLIIKAAVEKGAEIVTGLKLRMGSLNVGVLRPVVDIRNFKLLNPPNFPDRNMVDIPEIYVNYDLPAIMGGTMHLPEMRLNLKEFTVVKNAKGELNLDALRAVQAHKSGKSPSQEAKGKAPAIKIDSLKLSIGKVVYKDYSKGGVPDIKEFNINLNESYSNINDPYSLATLIMVKALMNTSIASLTKFDLKGMQGTVGDTLASAQKMASNAMSQAQTTVKQAQEQTKQAVETAKKAQDSAKKAVDVAQNLLR